MEELNDKPVVDSAGVEGYMKEGVDAMLVGRPVAERIRAWDPGVREPQKIRLPRDMVALHPLPERKVSAGGLHIPELAQDSVCNDGTSIHHTEQFHVGVVLGTGPGTQPCKEDGTPKACPVVPTDVEPGDKIRYQRASGRGMVWSDGELAVLILAHGGTDGGIDTIAWIEEDDESREDRLARILEERRETAKNQ
jgi:hypothetical protein